ncbi:MAG TPA: MBL fold metallo-hydrolase [Erysipelotrichaceae bacterium]|nr:MBL fold metallo-hydrolase [Erysipelotrichaceae bacterium]
MTVHIEWLGHSSFKLIYKEYQIVIDPFADNIIPGLKGVKEEAHLVLCSHEHRDHNARDSVTLLPQTDNPLTIVEIDSYHDNNHGLDRGKNKIVVLQDESIKLVHLGDIGCIPEVDMLEKMHKPDVLFVPIGGHYTLNREDIVRLIHMIQPKVIVPMHYKSNDFGPNVIGTLDEFTQLMDLPVINYHSSHFNYTTDMKNHIVVLSPKNII